MEENTYNRMYRPAVSLTKMKVENLRLRAYIGFQEWETQKLQDLIISYSFYYNSARAVETDQAEDAVDYKKITKDIIRLVDRQKFFLLERLAEEIFRIIKSNPLTRKAWVRVEKPHALRFADNVLAEISEEDRLNEVIIGIGSNINPEENTSKALTRLKNLGHIACQTDFKYTKPEGYKEQPDFLNGAILIYTPMAYEDLHDDLKSIERDLGRVRSENKNGPRIIDLDIAVYNHTITDDEVYKYAFLKEFVHELSPDLDLNRPV